MEGWDQVLVEAQNRNSCVCGNYEQVDGLDIGRSSVLGRWWKTLKMDVRKMKVNEASDTAIVTRDLWWGWARMEALFWWVSPVHEFAFERASRCG